MSNFLALKCSQMVMLKSQHPNWFAMDGHVPRFGPRCYHHFGYPSRCYWLRMYSYIIPWLTVFQRKNTFFYSDVVYNKLPSMLFKIRFLNECVWRKLHRYVSRRYQQPGSLPWGRRLTPRIELLNQSRWIREVVPPNHPHFPISSPVHHIILPFPWQGMPIVFIQALSGCSTVNKIR